MINRRLITNKPEAKISQKTSGNWKVLSAQRELFLSAQQLAPVKFIELTANSAIEAREVSAILKRIISNVLGKEIVGEKFLIANS